MDGGVAVAADGFEVGEVPGVEVEVLLAQSTLEWADAVVHLGGGREDATAKALLAEAAIAGHHLLTQRPPARVVVDQLVAAVVLVAGLLGLRLGLKNSGHLIKYLICIHLPFSLLAHRKMYAFLIRLL